MTSAVNPWEIESQPIVTYCPARHICLILFGRTVTPLVVVMEERSPPGAYDGIRGPAGPALLPIHERSEYRKSTRSYSSRSYPRLGHHDFADFHLRDAGAERDPRSLDLSPEGLRLRLQVGGVLVGTDPNELVLWPIDPGRHDWPADLVMDRLGLLFEVLDEGIQFALVDRINACLLYTSDAADE